MHKDPDDLRPVADWADTHQLAEGMETNSACQQCHPSIAQNVPSHTNHSADSSGSSCYNCHMPYTSYGLMRAIRSHTITSPSVEETVDVGRPNACNLCHLDQTLAWTGNHLEDWYGGTAPDLNEQQRTVAASILWLLKGDAGQRALMAWSYSWGPALEASGNNWQAPFLSVLMEDPYQAVQFIAGRSLHRLPDFDKIGYDFLQTVEEIRQQQQHVIDKWEQLPGRPSGEPAAAILIDPDGRLMWDKIHRLHSQRDNRRVNLVE